MDRHDHGGTRRPFCRCCLQPAGFRCDHSVAIPRRACGSPADDAARDLRRPGPAQPRRPGPGGAVVSETLHILRKDLTRLRWLLLVWVAVLIARVAFWSLGTSTHSGFAYAVVVSQSTGALGALQMVMLALVAARLVHEEPLAGWDAFWFTRPYSRNALMAAKLLFAAGVFVALPLIADLVTLALYHGGVRAQAEAAPTFLASYVTWTLLLLALAAMTPSLSAFVLTIVAALVSVSLLIVVFVAAALLLSEPSTGSESRVEDPAPALAGRLVVALTMLAVIVYQYRHRRWRTSAAVAVAGLVASLAVPYVWLSAFERPFVPEAGSWSPGTSSVVVNREWRM